MKPKESEKTWHEKDQSTDVQSVSIGRREIHGA